jgi:GntR family transcriptional regulator
MLIELDFRSHVPIYSQIVEQVKQLVTRGALQPGQQLPTVRQLAADLRVNFNTVARAYRMLDDAGVISTQQGRGTYVLEPADREQVQRLREASLEGLIGSFLKEAQGLGFEPQEVEERTRSQIDRWRQEGDPPIEAGI